MEADDEALPAAGVVRDEMDRVRGKIFKAAFQIAETDDAALPASGYIEELRRQVAEFKALRELTRQ